MELRINNILSCTWLHDVNKWVHTAKLKPIWTVGSGFSSISPSNLDQISKSGTVLKSWERVDFKTVPDFGIWPRFDGEIEEKPDPTVQFGLDFAVHLQHGRVWLHLQHRPKIMTNPKPSFMEVLGIIPKSCFWKSLDLSQTLVFE